VYEKESLVQLVREWRRRYPHDALAADISRRLDALK
jgi:hypothetical protein